MLVVGRAFRCTKLMLLQKDIQKVLGFISKARNNSKNFVILNPCVLARIHFDNSPPNMEQPPAKLAL